MKMTLARTIAHTLAAYKSCQQDTTGNKMDWAIEHRRRLEQMAKDLLPSGSGLDNATKIDIDRSTPERLVLTFGFHHMDANGYYAGWTDHTAIVTASLMHGMSLRITGRNRNQIKDYLYDTFDTALTAEVDYNPQSERYARVAV